MNDPHMPGSETTETDEQARCRRIASHVFNYLAIRDSREFVEWLKGALAQLREQEAAGSDPDEPWSQTDDAWRGR